MRRNGKGVLPYPTQLDNTTLTLLSLSKHTFLYSLNIPPVRIALYIYIQFDINKVCAMKCVVTCMYVCIYVYVILPHICSIDLYTLYSRLMPRSASMLQHQRDQTDLKPPLHSTLHIHTHQDHVKLNNRRPHTSPTSTPSKHSIVTIQSTDSNGMKKRELIIEELEHTKAIFSDYKHSTLAKGLPTSSSGLAALTAWLNDMATQANAKVNQMNPFGNKDSRSALDQSGLGRMLLKDASLSDQNVNEIYRGLFTFSLGCFRAIYNVIRHSSQAAVLIGKVWQAYSVLLERADPALHGWVIEATTQFNIRKRSEVSGIVSGLSGLLNHEWTDLSHPQYIYIYITLYTHLYKALIWPCDRPLYQLPPHVPHSLHAPYIPHAHMLYMRC